MRDEQIARIIGLAAAAALAAACFLVLRPFISALLWAVILAFVTWPAYRFLTDRARLRPTAAALVMVTAEFLLIAVPILLAAPVRGEDIEGIRRWIERLLTDGPPDLTPFLLAIPFVGAWLAEWARSFFGDMGGVLSTIEPYAGAIAQNALSVLLAVLSGVAEVVVAIILTFFFYRDGPAIAARALAVLRRLAGERADRLWLLTANVTRGVVYGLLGTALAQGFMTAIGLWISGVPNPVLLGVIAACISILPVGAPLVWIPSAIWLFATGSTGWGIFLTLYGALGISSVDNVIRPWLIARGADLPLLLTILGALGGVFAFGFLGLFLGPVALALGYTLLKDWASNTTEPGL
ncbi:AI-2E family transporter [Sabulicella glaciei]|uniref:AI-2E family transporter n=1 Tax=Sabulicella glaciei TaxID=2984948 RepID=A0ABT3NTA7_9PROT|nr:AI-2E family transporter [Roseococcus sp. MDT2-1-1]MCW8085394.1 AI-2E family transporter [Roseococcus sp. MDT2-1-1]